MKRAGIMGNSKPKRKKSAAAETRKLTPQQDSGIRKRKKAGWPPFHQQESLHDGGHPGANNTQGALTDKSRKAKVLFKLGQIYSSVRYLAEHIRGEPLILINVYSYFPMPPFLKKKRAHNISLFFSIVQRVQMTKPECIEQ